MSPSRLKPLPYFDSLFWRLNKIPEVGQAFGRHVHWGYWAVPPSSTPDANDFAHAAECLTREICNAAGCGDSMTLLDVGCGIGGTLASLDERYRDIHVVGLNIEHRQLRIAQDRVAPAQSNTLHWVGGDACHLPFADATFDAVTAVECIFHFPDRLAFLKEVFRVLKPGGVLALSDFIAKKRLRPLTWLRDRLPHGYGFYGKCNIHCDFSRYRKLAQLSGLTPLSERDVTANTLPTYVFLRDFGRRIGFRHPSAAIETFFLEKMSRAGWVKYAILSWQKPSFRSAHPFSDQAESVSSATIASPPGQPAHPRNAGAAR